MHEQPKESVEEWAKINVADPVAAACMARPGMPIAFHAPTLFQAPAAGPMRNYAKRYGRQSYMVCALTHEVHDDFIVWLSLYRSNPDAHFSESERRIYQQIIAHLNEAQQVNRQLQGPLHASSKEEVGAIADVLGYLHSPPDRVDDLVRLEWRHVLHGRLPSELMAALAASADGTYRGRTLCVRSRLVGGLLFLRLRRRSSFDALSVREHEVAQAVAHGFSAKEVGKSLAMAPATVRVHLKHIFAKLGVHSQAELAFLVGRSHEGSQ